jgi:hypothetical protein
MQHVSSWRLGIKYKHKRNKRKRNNRTYIRIHINGRNCRKPTGRRTKISARLQTDRINDGQEVVQVFISYKHAETTKKMYSHTE